MDLIQKNYIFKTVVLGNSGVGKTCLLLRYTKNVYQCPDLTIGCGYFFHSVDIEPGVHVKLNIWDTCGLERFRSVTRCYYRDAVGVLLVFDLTNRDSFENVKEWHAEVCKTEQSSKVFMLVGHKCDEEGRRKVSRDEGERLAEELGIHYVEASAKTGHNVREAIDTLAQQIYQKLPSGDAVPGFRIAEDQAVSPSQQKKCCT